MRPCVSRWATWTPDVGRPDGQWLSAADGDEAGTTSRAAAHVLHAVGVDRAAPVDAIVLATTRGEMASPGDPHGVLRRCVHRAFTPPGGTTLVSAGERTVAAALIDACVRLETGVRSVAVAVVELVPRAELAFAMRLEAATDQGGVAIAFPRLERCAAPAPARNPCAGALRLAEAIPNGSGIVVLDASVRDGLAWTVALGTAPD